MTEDQAKAVLAALDDDQAEAIMSLVTGSLVSVCGALGISDDLVPTVCEPMKQGVQAYLDTLRGVN